MSVPAVDPLTVTRATAAGSADRRRDSPECAPQSPVARSGLHRALGVYKRSGAGTGVPLPLRTHRVLYERCLAGREPAESLPPAERERLVTELHSAGWPDQAIADHTRMTLYTTARIRARLELSNRERQ